MLMEKEEEVIGLHMKYIKEVARLLKKEGDLITKVQGLEGDDDKLPVDKYVDSMMGIV